MRYHDEQVRVCKTKRVFKRIRLLIKPPPHRKKKKIIIIKPVYLFRVCWCYCNKTRNVVFIGRCMLVDWYTTARTRISKPSSYLLPVCLVRALQFFSPPLRTFACQTGCSFRGVLCTRCPKTTRPRTHSRTHIRARTRTLWKRVSLVSKY